MNPEDPELSELLRTQATRHRAPESLRQQLLSQLAEPAEPRAKPSSLVTTWLSRWATPHWGWRSASVGFAVGVLCAVLLQPMLSTQLASPSLDTELVNDHVQALQNDSLVAVISTDRHTVKPWFQGQLDYAPPVYDFAEQGFTLLGGRVQQLQGQTVAVLSYRHKLHSLDLFVWPASTPADMKARQVRGFELLRWADAAMQYGAVSDMDRAELQRFAQLWQARAAAP